MGPEGMRTRFRTKSSTYLWIYLMSALASDQAVLRHLYEVTDGTNWHRNEGWLGQAPHCGWASSSEYSCISGQLSGTPQPVCCELVEVSDTEPHIVRLDLSQNNLVGTIPSELALIKTLRLLVLDENSLSGTLPKQLTGLEHLNVLWVQYNRLSGTLPFELVKLPIKPHGYMLQGNDFSFCPLPPPSPQDGVCAITTTLMPTLTPSPTPTLTLAHIQARARTRSTQHT